MSENLSFIRFPILLLVLYFVGKLIVGASGGSYELGTRLFAMVPLTVHLCLAWGAVARAYRGDGAGKAVMTGALIALAAQILIIVGTAASYMLGLSTHFNHPVAVVGEDRILGFGEAMISRGVGLVVNTIIGSLAGLIGWALGGLIPANQPR